jgi:hypothetical protein
MAYALQFLAPFLKDKAVWVSAFSWLLVAANNWLHMGLNHDLLMTMAAGLSTGTAAHMAHFKFLGGDGKAPTDDELKG